MGAETEQMWEVMWRVGDERQVWEVMWRVQVERQQMRKVMWRMNVEGQVAQTQQVLVQQWCDQQSSWQCAMR